MSSEDGALPVLGVLPPFWRIASFGSVLLGGTRNGIYKPKQHHGSGAKIVNMGELFAHRRLHPVDMKRLRVTPSELERFGLQQGDLIFARRSLVAAGAGKCSLVCAVDEPTVFESSIIRARPDPVIADSAFLFYLFSSPYGEHALRTITRTVAVSGITGRDLAELRIPLPPLAEQHHIAGVLSALDDKIDLNRRMNRTLESIARAIFKSWFIDFDPVRKKMEGSDPAASDWPLVPFADTVEVLSGGTPHTNEPDYWGGSLPWYSVADWPASGDVFVVETEKTITDAGVASSAAQVVPPLTTIISARGTVGKCALSCRPMAFNQSCFGLRPSDGVGRYYTYFSTLRIVDQLRRSSHGSVFSTITRQTFNSVTVLLPPALLVVEFERMVRPVMERILANGMNSRVLQSLRDALLPRLLSGELATGAGRTLGEQRSQEVVA